MKRSEINQYIREAKVFFEKLSWKLPPFAYYTPERWAEIIENPAERRKHAEIIEHNLGWDVPDFGSGNFMKRGLFLFTIRNGRMDTKRNYAEKIMISRENQETPWHFHWDKVEDIINRGGGNLVVELYNRAKNDILKPGEPWTPGVFDTKRPVEFIHDGISEEVPAGSKVILKPGESIVLNAEVYHTFYGEKGKGMVLVGEVSRVNDDSKDNRFFEQLPRFLPIEKDEPPIHLLCNEYTDVRNILKK